MTFACSGAGRPHRLIPLPPPRAECPSSSERARQKGEGWHAREGALLVVDHVAKHHRALDHQLAALLRNGEASSAGPPARLVSWLSCLPCLPCLTVDPTECIPFPPRSATLTPAPTCAAASARFSICHLSTHHQPNHLSIARLVPARLQLLRACGAHCLPRITTIA